MALQDDNCSGNHETHGKAPQVLRTPRDRGAKLLADAQRTEKAASKQIPGQLLPKGENYRDLNIKRPQAQLAEMTQIVVKNRLMKPPLVDGEGPSKARSRVLRNPLREPRKKKRHEVHVDLES